MSEVLRRSFGRRVLMCFVVGLGLAPGCAKAERAPSAPPAAAMEEAPAVAQSSKSQAPGGQAMGNRSANANANANANSAPITRRIIHTGEVWLESDAADDAAKRVQALADQKGGFVISSNMRS